MDYSIMDDNDSQCHATSANTSRGLRSNAIQRKINELKAKDEETIKQTKEALSPTSPQIDINFLVPPRKLSNQLSGSLPNISFNTFQGDPALSPNVDCRGTPSPMRHERSITPRMSPFPTNSRHCGNLSPDVMVGSPQRIAFVPVPTGYPTLPINRDAVIPDSQLLGYASLESSQAPSMRASAENLSVSQFAETERQPLCRKRSSSFSPIFSSPDAQNQMGENMQNMQRPIPIPNIPNMPWNTAKMPQFTATSIPKPNAAYLPMRKCGCSGIPPALAQHQLRTAPDYYRTESGSPQSNYEYMSMLSPSQQNGNISRSSSSSSFDASFGQQQQNHFDHNRSYGDYTGISMHAAPNYHMESSAAGMANLSLEHRMHNQNPPVIPAMMTYANVNGQNSIPIQQGFNVNMNNVNMLNQNSYPQITINGMPPEMQNNFCYNPPAGNLIPSVVITEPFENAKGPPSPNEDALDKMLSDILSQDSFPSFMDDLENVDVSFEQNFEEDLAILNDIANRELHSEPRSNFT